MKIQISFKEPVEVPDKVGEIILRDQKDIYSGEEYVWKRVIFKDGWTYRFKFPITFQKVDG